MVFSQLMNQIFQALKKVDKTIEGSVDNKVFW